MASRTAFVIAAMVLAAFAVTVILRGIDLPHPFVSGALSGIAAAIITSVLINRSDL